MEAYRSPAGSLKSPGLRVLPHPAPSPAFLRGAVPRARRSGGPERKSRADRYREVVQRPEGLWLHPAFLRRPGCVRPHQRCGAGGPWGSGTGRRSHMRSSPTGAAARLRPTSFAQTSPKKRATQFGIPRMYWVPARGEGPEHCPAEQGRVHRTRPLLSAHCATFRNLAQVGGMGLTGPMGDLDGIRMHDDWGSVDPGFVARVVEALDGGEPKAIRGLTRDLHAADLADVLEALAQDDRVRLITRSAAASTSRRWPNSTRRCATS
jgi:hypothetical protein